MWTTLTKSHQLLRMQTEHDAASLDVFSMKMQWAVDCVLLLCLYEWYC